MRRLSFLRRLSSLGRRALPRSPETGAAGCVSVVVLGRPPPPRLSRPAACGPLPGDFRRSHPGLLRPAASHFQHQAPLCSGRSDVRDVLLRRFSTINERDDRLMEEEAERKAGWLLKLIFVGTATFVALEFFPYMGDNLLQQSISLLHVKDPLFKRMGASRLAKFAVDDERRMKVVEMGGAQELLNMLEAAKDDKTRKQALKALVALSHSDEAAEALHQAGASTIVRSTPSSLEYADVETYKSSLLKRFQELKHDVTSLEAEVN